MVDDNGIWFKFFLHHLFDENRIICQKDFLNPERKDLIVESATDSDAWKRLFEEGFPETDFHQKREIREGRWK